MNWDQNKELVEQILRTGMYAKLYDEETTYDCFLLGTL